MVTVVGSGTAEIVASQAGNSSFEPAPDVHRTFTAYPSTSLRLITSGVPTLKANGDTEVTHTFSGNVNSDYTIEYKSDLSANGWSPNPVRVQDTGNGTFSATFTATGNYVNAWKNRMFFRAKNS
jgi:hypothetical protein